MIEKFKQTPAEYAQLVEQAKEMTLKSYAPYSRFNVGAAVLLSNGNIITGSNQENAAYGECICAERVALLYATANYPDAAPVAIAIAASTDGRFTEECVTPCGSCCQVLTEMQTRFGSDIKVIMYGTNEVFVASGAQDLLPLQFNNSILPDRK